ncbi:SMI1/KNR4 family protein [Streptomyces sp. NPDC006477]|uniref:SMI1/KNR4 family protein n=1 Tax=Streptomyces sp. NPDC006477 TaxID=3364747 RepID=UPI0036B44210
MTDQQWAGIRQRVEALKASPASNDVFGAWGHRWVLEQPLSHAELAELEAQMKVTLPEEFRAFLLLSTKMDRSSSSQMSCSNCRVCQPPGRGCHSCTSPLSPGMVLLNRVLPVVGAR